MLIKSFLQRIPPSYIPAMANSKFEYVRNYETDDRLLPNCWIVVRVDGRNFHKFASKHKFEKPNDSRALNLMNKAALTVMEEFKDVIIAYGQSDEYSFIVRKDTGLFNRRASKIMSCINSLFSSAYVFHWPRLMDVIKLKYPPAFDSRVILYPTDGDLKDYLSWRQVDCHINNLYNTTFWNLVQRGGLTNDEAEKRLKGTLSAEKNEILFSAFGINYNNENAMFKKGTILLRKRIQEVDTLKSKIVIIPFYEDFVKEPFWMKNSEILQLKSPGIYIKPDDKSLPDLVLEQYPFVSKKVKES